MKVTDGLVAREVGPLARTAGHSVRRRRRPPACRRRPQDMRGPDAVLGPWSPL